MEQTGEQGGEKVASKEARHQEAQRRILGTQEVLRIVPLSRVTLWRLERKGQFPQRIQVSANRVGWFADEVEAWLESRHRVGQPANTRLTR